ncbi:metallophosphoesterase [Vibrio sp. 10N.261.51.F12]|uniref:metallophosphoesterase family protein n=1 Tax=Vibrio sp. 10N.261.51.F12 TaxID=3229679 RepID=UPI00354E9B6E
MKKIAVMSDIHSNVHALKAVVAHAKSKGVSDFINLGDILYGPIAPRATYDFLQSLNAVTICGNQDRQIYQATHAEIEFNPTMQFILQDLGEEPLEWMRQLPFDCHINDDIYACHGTPSDDLVYLLEEVSSGCAKVREDKNIIELLGHVSAPIVLCGHTHIPRSVQLSTGQMVINPGSVGLPAYEDDAPLPHRMETYSAMASYTVMAQSFDGSWQPEFYKVPYDVGEAAKAANARHRDDWVHFLTTGRCLAEG